MRYRTEEAARASAAAHRRLDGYNDRLIGVEKDQAYQKERFDEAVKEIKDTLRDLKIAIDGLVRTGLHCSHCERDGAAG